MRQFDLFSPPVIERRSEIPAGAVFQSGGRFLKIYRVFGTDDAAPVIVEELQSFGKYALAGQYGLWSQDAVRRALDGGLRCK